MQRVVVDGDVVSVEPVDAVCVVAVLIAASGDGHEHIGDGQVLDFGIAGVIHDDTSAWLLVRSERAVRGGLNRTVCSTIYGQKAVPAAIDKTSRAPPGSCSIRSGLKEQRNWISTRAGAVEGQITACAAGGSERSAKVHRFSRPGLAPAGAPVCRDVEPGNGESVRAA